MVTSFPEMTVSHTSPAEEKIALFRSLFRGRENGFFILRFLCEDLGKNLDLVLDTIRRTMVSLNR